jgi:hypothetical protein
MATVTLQIAAEANQPPNKPGVVSISIAYNELYPFTLADYTTLASPIFSDPDGDSLESIKILTLPAVGTLTLSSVAVIADDVITSAQLTAGNLEYQADPADTDGYGSSFTYTSSDDGSSTFSFFTGSVTIIVAAQIANLPPDSVGTGSATITYGETLVFTSAMFTSGTIPAYNDPEGDPALFLKITGIPTLGIIYLAAVEVAINEIVDMADIDLGLLTYVPDLTDTDGDLQGFTFELADTSGIFVG